MNKSENAAPMIIAQIEPPHIAEGGDYYYRTHAPGIAMAQAEGVHVVNLTSQHRRGIEIMGQADVLASWRWL